MCRAQPYRVGHSPFDFGAFFIKVYGDVAVINGTGQRVLFCWPATDEAGVRWIGSRCSGIVGSRPPCTEQSQVLLVARLLMKLHGSLVWHME